MSTFSEIWSWSQNKNRGLLIPQTPLADKFLHGALEPVNAYRLTKSQLVSEIETRSQNEIWDTSRLPHLVR